MGVSLSGLQEAVDRCESEVGEFEIEGVGLAANPDAQRLRQADGDPVLCAPHSWEGHRLAAIEGFD
jgi:hypothetical protein